MKIYSRYTAAASLSVLLAIASCTEKEPPVTSPESNTPITLSIGTAGEDSPVTKAVITDSKTPKENLPDGTHIFMLMKSDYVENSTYPFTGETAAKYSVTRGQVTNGNKVSFTDDASYVRSRYWEDIHSRCSHLSIWAIACPGLGYLGGTGTNLNDSNVPFNTSSGLIPWQTTAVTATSIDWNVPHYGSGNHQTVETVKNRDLLFSNNIANYLPSPGTDRRLHFDTSTKKFTSGELFFYRAMSKITVKILIGDGFTSSDPFKFQGDTRTNNIILTYFNIWGKFSIADGGFTQVNDGHQAIMSMADPSNGEPDRRGGSNPAYTLEALAIPYLSSDEKSPKGSLFDQSANPSMQFYIDNSKYVITRNMLYSALKANAANNHLSSTAPEYPLEAGKNYIFTFRVSKTGIDHITAQVAAWENVVAEEHTAKNAYVSVNVKSEGTAVTGAPTFDLLRAAGETYSGTDYNSYADYTWEKGYAKSTGLTWDSTNSKYTTEWYWPDNKTYYHFRTLSPTEQTVMTLGTTTDYVEVAGGKIKSGEVTAEDYIWGAPFKSGAPTPDVYSFTSGFCNNANKADGQLYKAIGATENAINLIQHHMTSQVFVDLESVAGTGAVNLVGAEVTITNVRNSGKLYLGNGLVTDYGDATNILMTSDAHAAASPVPAYDFSYGVLPQTIANGDKIVGLDIKLANGNHYIIPDLRVVKVGSVSIDAWKPGHKYYYKLVLGKSAINNLTATIVDWNDIVAEYGDDDHPIVIQ